MMNSGPLVSIVTPSYNSSRFIKENLQSVENQSYENIEHIIVDGNSTDDTIDIVRNFENERDIRWISEPDEGMYDAIEKGFDMASGDVYAWLNSDDMYLPWAVEVAVKHLSQEGVEWITGHPARWDEDGVLYYVNPLQPHYHRSWIRKGWYHGDALGWMQQESMFWTANLWEKRGGFPNTIELAGDYYLWKNFAKESDIEQVGTILAGFRKNKNQLTEDIEKYRSEIPDTGIVPKMLSILYIQNLYSLSLNLIDYLKWKDKRR